MVHNMMQEGGRGYVTDATEDPWGLTNLLAANIVFQSLGSPICQDCITEQGHDLEAMIPYPSQTLPLAYGE